ncbi:MAG TPA: Gfo/Idh/MocA family oxidoreductase [Dehalococcoidia bacterium]|nr:Gfo/Idh/MocA family oxidoreductase [Dehalococcoidia bacterium]
MADKIRIGIVGATVTPGGSQWGARAHVPALKALPEYELKAVCTAHEDTARASAAQFGAELAFHNIDDMVAHPEIDLVVVSVKVPVHYPLVMSALRAGKAVYCEWPLGANLREAEEMANLAHEKSVRTAVGLQARSDPTMMYARELIQQGQIGEVITASLSITSQAALERASDRVWQGEWAAGANPLTIPGGHSIDSLCFILGEFAEVSARVSTRIKEWKLTDTGGTIKVDAPDTISVAGALTNGAEVSVYIATVPSNPGGYRLDIYGREGALTVTTPGSANIGVNQVYLTKGREAPAAMAVPDRFKLVPEGTPQGQPLNVAQAYTRFADSLQAGDPFDPDFDMAVTRHRLIDAIERSSKEGKSIRL